MKNLCRGCSHCNVIKVVDGFVYKCTKNNKIIGLSEENKEFDREACDDFVHFEIGKPGPAGGLVFYDKGYYSDGWRFLEAAPEDISVDSTFTFVFGYYRKSAEGSNLYVNGKTNFDDTTCAGAAVGTGKRNTQLLVGAMGESAYVESAGSSRTSVYAAKLCDDYECGGYSDWFLPSKDELNLMYTNLALAGLGDFDGYGDSYWSSSEYDYYYGTGSAWLQFFDDGSQGGFGRFSDVGVRAVRQF